MINKIFNEDCLITMSRMKDDFIDLVITSPPYDDIRDYKGYSFDFESITKEIYRVIKVGGVVVWIVGDTTINGSETLTSFKQALYFKEIGFNVHDTMIYVKNAFPFPSSNRYLQQFEYMFVLSKDRPKTTNLIKCNNKRSDKIEWGTQRKKDGQTKQFQSIRKKQRILSNVWIEDVGYMKSSKDKIAYEHPAIFPESLINKHILTWSNKNDIVYDPFMGSGTTAKMALLNERYYIGSEISKEYCDIAEKRIKSLKTMNDLME